MILDEPVVTPLERPPMPVRGRLYAHLPRPLRRRAARAMARTAQRRPPESRLRRKLFGQAAFVQFEAYAAGDYDLMLNLYHPEAVGEVPSELQLLGFDATHRGHDGVRAFLRQWAESWEIQTSVLHALHDFGAFTVLDYELGGRGAASGATIRQPAAFCVFQAPDDGRVIRQGYFLDFDDAVAWGRRVAAG